MLTAAKSNLMGESRGESTRRAAEGTTVGPLKDSGHPSSDVIENRDGYNNDVSKRMDVSRPGLTIAVIFVASLFILSLVVYTFPELDDEDMSRLRWPHDLASLKDLARLLSKYKDTHYYTVLAAVIIFYIFLQTFAIPGSIFLSILSGFLFPFPTALLLVCTCSAMGAAFCYLLSAYIGRGLIQYYFPERIEKWRHHINQHRHDMLWYILFLRITPLLPNWFTNISSPIVGVRLSPFFWGTFFGVAPPSFFFIQAGTTLYELTTTTSHISISSILIITILAIISLLPVLYKRFSTTKYSPD